MLNHKGDEQTEPVTVAATGEGPSEGESDSWADEDGWKTPPWIEQNCAAFWRLELVRTDWVKMSLAFTHQYWALWILIPMVSIVLVPSVDRE